MKNALVATYALKYAPKEYVSRREKKIAKAEYTTKETWIIVRVAVYALQFARLNA